MTNIIQWLKGKKTYIVGVLAAIINILLAFGIITLTNNQIFGIDGLFIALFGISFRSALNTVSK